MQTSLQGPSPIGRVLQHHRLLAATRALSCAVRSACIFVAIVWILARCCGFRGEACSEETAVHVLEAGPRFLAHPP